jgi:YVTN family beta-propeller protein
MIRLTMPTKLLSVGVALSLGWIVLEACDCNQTKEDQFPGYWVTCIANQPTLMTYSGNNPTVVTSDAAGAFSPAQYDCSHAGSPQYKGSESSFKIGSPSGPAQFVRPHATGSPTTAYLPQRFRDLPFTPNVPPPGTPPVCQSNYPDVLQTDHEEALVTHITTCPFKIVATIPVQTRPLQIAITPDGSTALVTSFDNVLNFINLSTNKVTYQLQAGSTVNPSGIAISPDGTKAYMTSFNGNNPAVLVIDMASQAVVATIPTMTYPSGATLTPDGSQLWVTSVYNTETDVIDTLSNTVVTRLNYGASTDIAFNSTGTLAYETIDNNPPGKVLVFNTSTYQVVNTYTVGNVPADIAMSYGDQFLVVNNSGDNTVSVIDLVKNIVTTTPVNGVPSGIAFVQ